MLPGHLCPFFLNQTSHTGARFRRIKPILILESYTDIPTPVPVYNTLKLQIWTSINDAIKYIHSSVNRIPAKVKLI